MRHWGFYVLLLCGVLLAGVGGSGCGGGENRSPNGLTSATATATGRASFTVRWPERGRLIPSASSSIRVTLTKGSALVAERLLTRPATGTTTTADFDRLPVGDVTFRAVALPNMDGTGVAQAQAESVVPIVTGQVAPVRLTMASTIDRIEVTPPGSFTLSRTQTQQLNATAKNAAGETVLTAPLQWLSANTAVAVVDASGKVSAIAVGTTQITARDTESGKSASVAVTFTDAPGPAATITFQNPSTYSVPFASDVLIADMDGDGNNDLIASGSADLGIFYGRGTGALEAYASVLSRPSGIGVRAAADMNGDGRKDLLCVSGSRQFAAPIEVTVTSDPHDISVGDLNGDSRLDFVLALPNSGAGRVAAVLNEGNGSFRVGSYYSMGGHVLSVRVGEVNGDGILDFVAAATTSTVNRSGGRLYIGRGDGNFVYSTALDTGTGNVTGPQIADFNRDNRTDILIGNYSDNNIALLLGTGGTGFQPPARYSAAPYPLVPVVADMNADGWPDIVTSNAGTSNCSVLLNKGDGTLDTAQQFPSGGSNTRGCDVGDLNNDGRPDIVLANENTRNVTVLINTSR
jgi:hypothetical protein